MLLRLLTLVAVLQVVLTSEVGRNVTNRGIDPKFDFVTIGDHRYYFSPVEIDSLVYAMETCADVGAALVSLETEEEFNAINNYIANDLGLRNTYFWTSGMWVDRKWIWTGTGRTISYFKWATSEPDVTSSYYQSCMQIYNGLMYDVPCTDYSERIICEENKCSIN